MNEKISRKDENLNSMKKPNQEYRGKDMIPLLGFKEYQTRLRAYKPIKLNGVFMDSTGDIFTYDDETTAKLAGFALYHAVFATGLAFGVIKGLEKLF